MFSQPIHYEQHAYAPTMDIMPMNPLSFSFEFDTPELSILNTSVNNFNYLRSVLQDVTHSTHNTMNNPVSRSHAIKVEARRTREQTIQDVNKIQACHDIIEIMALTDTGLSIEDALIQLQLFHISLQADIKLWVEEGSLKIVGSDRGRYASTRRRSGQSAIVCLWCASTFTGKHNLANHVRAHLDVHLSFCPNEGCTFSSTNTTLPKRHLQGTKGITPLETKPVPPPPVHRTCNSESRTETSAVSSLTADPREANDAVAQPFDWRALATSEASEPTKHVDMEDIDVNDIIVLVMGQTGVGKSTFVQAAERVFHGSTSVCHTVSHDLTSGTKNVECLSIPIPHTKSKLILVDTPGFDDQDRPDSEILETIATWLSETYSQKKQINGIIYLHRINDLRFDAGVAMTLSYFQKLCGGGPVYGRVVLTTSFWNNVSFAERHKYERKERELHDGHWKAMLHRTNDPASASRFDCTTADMERETVCRTLWTLVKSVNKTVLLLQKELVDKKLSLPKTTVGKVVFTTEEKIRYQIVQLAGLLQPPST
ncbi:hypothetical protein CVT24_004862 [Panaeolus cyanescens]|uniref:C2H2-type domain-containing protein n=1 Tax=Panaeolus cyanescens TaxID=181874 RepID=A0A409VD80_9AGAR|nr:hypothetical protein CVT24_004862 [Panaeolus cyanescens]